MSGERFHSLWSGTGLTHDQLYDQQLRPGFMQFLPIPELSPTHTARKSRINSFWYITVSLEAQMAYAYTVNGYLACGLIVGHP